MRRNAPCRAHDVSTPMLGFSGRLDTITERSATSLVVISGSGSTRRTHLPSSLRVTAVEVRSASRIVPRSLVSAFIRLKLATRSKRTAK